jgi:diguanylate cyclase (GGDEF)-like protein/PAS domain S-box-containing protein
MAALMLDFFHSFIAPPDSSLLYSGHYDPLLVSLSVAIAIFASYAALLVSQHVTSATTAATSRIWLAVGGLCLGLGIWAMHFIGMLAFSLPCSSGFDISITLFSMIPSVLASTLALRIISRRVLSFPQLVLGGLLLGSGIGTMHYAGMAAMRLDGLIRYDLKLFVLSVLVAVILATMAIWLKFRLQSLQMRWNTRAPIISAVAMGLAVSGMHYTAMAAAYFLREGDSGIVDSQIGATFLASTVLAATSLIIVVTMVATYVARPNLLALGRSYKVIGLLILGWGGISWLSANYYYNSLADNLYQQELQSADKELDNVAELIQASLQRLKAIPLVFSYQEEIHRALRPFGPGIGPSALAYEARKRQWTQDRVLGHLNHSLSATAPHLQTDVIWILNAAGDCIAASNHDQSDSFIGSNYSAREYFQQARAGQPGHQYAVGLTSKLPGLYYAYPVIVNDQFIGAVIVKRNVSNFSYWIEQAHAFVTDANGVIVLAADKSFQFRTLPAAPATKLTEPQKLLQYGQTTLAPLAITAWGEKQLASAVRIENGNVPTILVSRGLAENLITVHLSRPMSGIAHLRVEKNWLFTLLAAAGSLLILSASAIVLYLRESRKTEVDLRIAAAAFDSQECMMITDANNVILRVNQAFTDVSGYAAEEVVGKTPELLRSGLHEADFYATLWNSIQSSDSWQGEIWDRRKSGEVYPAWCTITAVRDKNGLITHHVSVHADITQRKAAEEEIFQLAFYDQLTRLPNRRLLLDRLQQALASSTRSDCHGALLFIDLDNFKTLNDTLGHDTGDLLLKAVATRLTTCVREGDTVARLGGDEFVVMLEDLNASAEAAAAQAQIVGEKILTALNQIYRLADYEHHSTPSIGITLFADHHDTIDELLKRADLAMYQAKAVGRNTLRFFDPEMQAAVNARAAMEADLREAIGANQFLLHYQVQVDAVGRPTGAEALVRWQHPRNGIVSPDKFIPLAEDTGLILPLGQWVLEAACTQLVAWSKKLETAHFTVAVNVSPRQFHHPDFVSQVLSALTLTGADPRQLKLELTEGLLVDDVEGTIAKMTELKASGLGFSLDDFGTGYSSLSYLKRLPLDQLKIDQSFVRDVFTDANDAAIVRTIVALAQSLGLDVIAEGVETEAQRNFLASQGCLAYQGYLFGRPVPAAELPVRASASDAQSM